MLDAGLELEPEKQSRMLWKKNLRAKT